MSSSEDEDLVKYGLPLDPIDEDALPKRKPIPIEEQIVTDEHGRRRFHGAFTGGYSAGFYNTVGSLEGWLPAPFKSSREKKAKYKIQNIEDFMDEEDKGEFGICPTGIKVQPKYENQTIGSKRPHSKEEGPLPGTPVLNELFQPVRETIGIKLLMNMGWKPGQGVGPRVTKIQKRKQREEVKATNKIYGCSLPDNFRKAESESESDSDDDVLVDCTFAPDEFGVYTANPKRNTFGLGYTGLDRTAVLSSSSSEKSSRFMVEGKAIHGQAFGIGALEEDDDCDIYVMDDMSRYDFSLEGNKRERKKPTRWSDLEDKTCIEGFHESIRKLNSIIDFPLMDIPQDYIPIHTMEKTINTETGGRIANNADDRFKILNQDTVPAPPPELFTKVQNTSLVFKPFSSDPEKQDRYEQFLHFKKNKAKQQLCAIQPYAMTEWERDKERLEFEGAARLYRPLCLDMADRFTSATQPDDVSNLLEPVARNMNAQENTMREAAKMKMYGTLTRERISWIPDKIIYKRFNIAEPTRNSLQFTAESTSKPAKRSNIFDCLSSNVIKNEPQDTAAMSQPSTSAGAKIADIEMNHENQVLSVTDDVKESVELHVDAETKLDFQDDSNLPNVTVDLFKAIFLDSEDEEDINVVKSVVEIETKKINMSPPRGIFANLDLDLISKTTVMLELKIDEEIPEKHETIELEQEVDLYGPKIPDNLLVEDTPVFQKVVETKNVKEKEKWVEKTESSKQKKHKKKHKKEKKKKRKSRESILFGF